jgi:serine/threonine protein kinase
MPDTPLALGSLLGPYRLDAELGRGGFGVVFSATDTRDGSILAVKTLLADLTEQHGQRAHTRFKREIEAVSRLRHPHVIRILGADTELLPDGNVLAYYAMERIDGMTLDKVVREKGPLDPWVAVRVVEQAARGLHVAHLQGVVHRDVKPENIMLGHDGRVVVMDFGICKLADVGNITAAGTVVGTSRYLSPEQFLGRVADARADQFALGAVLFFLVAGQHLRRSKDVTALVKAVSTGEDARRIQAAPTIPPALRELLLRATAPDPEARFSSSDVLADALHDLGEALGQEAGIGRDEEYLRTTVVRISELAGNPGRRASTLPSSDLVTRVVDLQPVARVSTAARDGPPAGVQLPPVVLPSVPLPPPPVPAPTAAPVAEAGTFRCEDCESWFGTAQDLEAHGASCSMRQWHDRMVSMHAATPPPPPAPESAPPWDSGGLDAPSGLELDTSGRRSGGPARGRIRGDGYPAARPVPPVEPVDSAVPAPWETARGWLPPSGANPETSSELEEMYGKVRGLGSGEHVSTAVRGLDAVGHVVGVLEGLPRQERLVAWSRWRLLDAARCLVRLALEVHAHRAFLARFPPAEVERQLAQLRRAADPSVANAVRRKEALLTDARGVEEQRREGEAQMGEIVDVMELVEARLRVLVAGPAGTDGARLEEAVQSLVTEVEATVAAVGPAPGGGPA